MKEEKSKKRKLSNRVSEYCFQVNFNKGGTNIRYKAEMSSEDENKSPKIFRIEATLS